jgi:hypothetical protein
MADKTMAPYSSPERTCRNKKAARHLVSNESMIGG